MTIFDLTIIYLACGAPFGVYYFLHDRKRSVSRQFWAKTILVFLFWIPFAYKLLKNGKIKRKLFNLKFHAQQRTDSEQEKRLFVIKQQIEKLFLEARFPVSIFEMREVFDRYAGLTLEGRNHDKQNSERAAELFRIAKRENVHLGAICLQRRNLKRLEFHQKQARKDFLKLLGNLVHRTERAENLKFLSLQFAEILRDETARTAIENLFAHNLQTGKKISVNKSEKDLWKPEIHKPQPARQLSINLQSLRARTNSLSKD